MQMLRAMIYLRRLLGPVVVIVLSRIGQQQPEQPQLLQQPTCLQVVIAAELYPSSYVLAGVQQDVAVLKENGGKQKAPPSSPKDAKAKDQGPGFMKKKVIEMCTY